MSSVVPGFEHPVNGTGLPHDNEPVVETVRSFDNVQWRKVYRPDSFWLAVVETVRSFDNVQWRKVYRPDSFRLAVAEVTSFFCSLFNAQSTAKVKQS